MASYLGSVIGNWKPSKGTGKAVLPCFRPIPCPSLSEDDTHSFCSSLSKELVKLEQSLGESSTISLQWSAEAMALLKKMQVELLDLFRKSKLPISFGAKEDWFDQYMKQTALVLDLCNSLKSVVSGISRYRMVVDLTIEKIQKDLSAAPVTKIEFERIETECRQLLGVGKWRDWMRPTDGAPLPSESNNCEKGGTGLVMLTVKSTTLALSLILLSAFIFPVEIDVGDEQVINELPQLKPFTTSLKALVSRFHETILKCEGSVPGMVLAEHEMVEKLVGDLKSQVIQGLVEDGEFSRSVQLLRQRSLGLKEGIEIFDSAVNEVFEVVIKGRNELLGTFRDGDLI